ncbi:MAG: hypothetical protein J5860_00785 [Clostridia bacterium]|nr:hypothetical protein [Clostridia bacterium]MBO4428416.1 hypothetical protein [Clostridia bacterium]
MTDTVQSILNAADGGVRYKTQKLPKVKIRQESPMPSLTLIGVIAITLVLLFCVFSAVQILQIKSEIYELRGEKAELSQKIETVEGLTEVGRAETDAAFFKTPFGK